jgi:hypothetical protein
MKRDKYHGILLDMAFQDKAYPEKFKVFSKITSGDWTLYGVEIEADGLKKIVSDIRENMRSDQGYYLHLYNDEDLIVIFKNRVFEVTSHESSWGKVIEYGKQSGIPDVQLDFWPNRFQDEIHYFKK